MAGAGSKRSSSGAAGSSRSEASQLVFALRAIAMKLAACSTAYGHDLFINVASRGLVFYRMALVLTVDRVKALNMHDVKVSTRQDSRDSSLALIPSLQSSADEFRSRAPRQLNTTAPNSTVLPGYVALTQSMISATL